MIFLIKYLLLIEKYILIAQIVQENFADFKNFKKGRTQLSPAVFVLLTYFIRNTSLFLYTPYIGV